jgi:hypothetical protein
MILAPLAVATAHAPTAAAAPDPSKSPASTDIMLTGGSMRSLEKKLADKADWGTDRDAREGARTAIQSVEAGIKRIKSADPKWDLSDWEKTLKAGKDRLKAADDQLAKQEGDAAAWQSAYREYINAEHKLEGILKLMDKVQSKPSEVELDSEQIYGRTAAEIATVDALDKACKAKGFGKLKLHPEYKSYLPAEVGCRLAASWKDLGKKYVEIQAKGAAKREAEKLEKAMKGVEQGDSISAANHKWLLDPKGAIAYFKERYDAPAKAFDATVDPSWLDAFNTVAAKYPAALAEAAKTSKWDAAAKIQDGATTSLYSKAHAAGGEMPEGKVLKVAALADWSVEKDAFNTPVSRERDVKVMVQVKGESYCRVYGSVVKASYKGGWSAPFTMGGGANILISACK